MRYGLFYLPSSLPATRAEGAARFRRIVDQIAYGEEIGFDSVWLAEHHFHSFAGMFSSPTIIGAAIAERTKSMRIGTAVLLLPYHNPLRVAEDCATLDCLSNGRLEFGIGHGFVKWEALNFGIPLDELRDRFKENLDVVLKAWKDPVLKHQGRFHEYNGVQVYPRPMQEPHPAVWMAATTSVESFELSGRCGFHMMLIPFLNEVEELRRKMQVYFSAREAAGFDRSTARVLGVYHAYVGESSTEARAAGAQGLAEYNAAARDAHSLTPGMTDPESYRSHERHRAQIRALSFEELVDQSRVLVGTAADVREKLEYVRERLYLTDVAGNFSLGGLTDVQARASTRRFMEEVAPKIR
ncbi:MAG TPA: LLM class flavin-dependent oxidoreductase [Candidatus Limnocylindria bacterium]|nr:LLM class flavin-dependent oxidoreductase [Candidatus Limnocylindria bacterium]